jgi:hypothetical protein
MKFAKESVASSGFQLPRWALRDQANDSDRRGKCDAPQGDDQHSCQDGLERSLVANSARVLSCLRGRMIALIGELRAWLDARFLYFPAMVQIACFIGGFWNGSKGHARKSCAQKHRVQAVVSTCQQFRRAPVNFRITPP